MRSAAAWPTAVTHDPAESLTVLGKLCQAAFEALALLHLQAQQCVAGAMLSMKAVYEYRLTLYSGSVCRSYLRNSVGPASKAVFGTQAYRRSRQDRA